MKLLLSREGSEKRLGERITFRENWQKTIQERRKGVKCK